ncbi:hypothetical protein F5884DRAFT_794367 [Xylogone sp. PMI_703]|nr:hypothetical protein F5884DRAFT_794367 [Xylogone sp. PMI_703]
METIDPSTGRPLPPDAIQRVLFICPKVHVYNIPPLTSTKGYVAAQWTENNNARQIFTARLRVLETAIPTSTPTSQTETDSESVKTDIILEDPSNGALFAAAPYTTPSVVEQVLDSSRFFAIRVEGEGGRKAVLGIGFEERPEAFDFSVCLQEVRRTLGIQNGPAAGSGSAAKGRRPGVPAKQEEEKKPEEKRDFSLKEGETITVTIGSRGAGRRNREKSDDSKSPGLGGAFSLPPPPGSGVFLPPPPSTQELKAEKRRSRNIDKIAIEDMGFDDGEFGEFQ